MININILYHRFMIQKNVGKTTFFFAIFLHIILPFTQFEFMLEKDKYSIAIMYVELENKAKIRVIGYNEIADKCYQKLKINDVIWIEGYLENLSEVQIVIKIFKQTKK